MELPLSRAVIRSFRPTDAVSLARFANNRRVWINLRDRFPSPYKLKDAQGFLRALRKQEAETTFAIAVRDEAVGTIGVVLQSDVGRVSAEIGYWLGEPFWGLGIMSEAVPAFSVYALDTYALTRLFAQCFSYNRGSIRVLEKSGYVLEGVCRRAAVKDGLIVDQLQYARYDK